MSRYIMPAHTKMNIIVGGSGIQCYCGNLYSGSFRPFYDKNRFPFLAFL